MLPVTPRDPDCSTAIVEHILWSLSIRAFEKSDRRQYSVDRRSLAEGTTSVLLSWWQTHIDRDGLYQTLEGGDYSITSEGQPARLA